MNKQKEKIVTFDLKEEMKLLENNYYNQLKIHFNLIDFKRSQFTFRKDNWLLTFPFNFYNNGSLELIRKLALINSFYLSYFLAEDDVVDDYNMPILEFREIIKKFLKMRSLNNLAIGQFLNVFGQEFYEYIFDYEDKYYCALRFEKNSLENISLDNMLENSNLKYLGYKLMPLCVCYAGYCLNQDHKENIGLCEELIINYHIAKQLYDDFVDLDEDFQKPDLSYLIKACKVILTKNEFSVDSIKQVLIKNSFYKNYFFTINKYLDEAENIAKKLNFIIFVKEIQWLKNRSDLIYTKIKIENK